MIMKIKLIACDMDGTLLTNEHLLSQPIKDAVQEATAKGIKFCIATGRMFCSALPFAKQLGLDTPIISYNGALVKSASDDRVYHSQTLDKDLAESVLALCKKNDWYVQKYVEDVLSVDRITAVAKSYSEQVRVRVHAQGEDFYRVDTAPHKLLLVVDPLLAAEVSEEIKASFGSDLVVTSSSPRFIELIPLGVNKGVALAALAASFGISPAEVMACGDSYNDLEMLKFAGYSIAMDNAVPELKDVASFVTKSNQQDGVALAIRRFALG